MAQLLYHIDEVTTEQDLTRLADGALTIALEQVDPEAELVVVALGKYGSRELALGSDLDIMLLAEHANTPATLKKARQLLKLLQHKESLGPGFEVDIRLRPHGQDGPLVTSCSALEAYHARGSGQPWERQMLARARIAAGNEQTGTAFVQLQQQLLFSRAIGVDEAAEIHQMRMRAEHEKSPREEPRLGIKTGPGGLMDAECIAQLLQLTFGHAHPEYRTPGTRELIRKAAVNGHLQEDESRSLVMSYDWIRRVECVLRRRKFTPDCDIPESDTDCAPLACWLGFKSVNQFQQEHFMHMDCIRHIYAAFVKRRFAIDVDVR